MNTNKKHLNEIKGWNGWVSRNLLSTPSIKIQEYAAANLVPMAMPDICC